MSGRVSVRYWSTPARLRYSVELASGVPSVSEGLALVSAGVRQGLQLGILAH
jgi:hypothetical protein